MTATQKLLAAVAAGLLVGILAGGSSANSDKKAAQAELAELQADHADQGDALAKQIEDNARLQARGDAWRTCAGGLASVISEPETWSERDLYALLDVCEGADGVTG